MNPRYMSLGNHYWIIPAISLSEALSCENQSLEVLTGIIPPNALPHLNLFVKMKIWRIYS